jgi:hypothetical protein
LSTGPRDSQSNPASFAKFRRDANYFAGAVDDALEGASRALDSEFRISSMPNQEINRLMN